MKWFIVTKEGRQTAEPILDDKNGDLSVQLSRALEDRIGACSETKVEQVGLMSEDGDVQIYRAEQEWVLDIKCIPLGTAPKTVASVGACPWCGIEVVLLALGKSTGVFRFDIGASVKCWSCGKMYTIGSANKITMAVSLEKV